MKAALIRKSTVRADFDLLCLMVRPKPDLPRALELLRRDSDVEALLRLAERHSIRPRLIVALAALTGEGLPEVSRSSLAAFRQIHLVRALSAAQQLSQVAMAFSERRICFAAFK